MMLTDQTKPRHRTRKWASDSRWRGPNRWASGLQRPDVLDGWAFAAERGLEAEAFDAILRRPEPLEALRQKNERTSSRPAFF